MGYMHRPLPLKAEIDGIKIEYLEIGEGRPLLYLHPVDGVHEQLPFLQRLKSKFRVIAPSHPGFGASELPGRFSAVDDLAYFYLDLMDAMNLRDVVLVGSSFGGWIASEIATKCCSRVSHLVLAGSLGCKFGDRETQDVADYFAVAIPDLPNFLFHDREAGLAAFNNCDFESMSDEEILYFTRNREAFALFNWNPNGYNPKLKARLHRIGVPALVLWGDNDRVVPESYGRAYAAVLPKAKFEVIPGSGHYPHVEKPEAFADAIISFTR